ncbi:hypothetical protein JCM6882_001273 [Rhodosporidiobolus microsporus]
MDRIANPCFSPCRTSFDSPAHRNVELIVFPEMTLSTFFPRFHIEDDAELASSFEKEPAEGIAHAKVVAAFFDKANELDINVAIGYGEDAVDGVRYNTASYFSRGKTVGKYRKIHLPGPSSRSPRSRASTTSSRSR